MAYAMTRLVSLLVDLFSVAEPLAPPAISFYLGRRLNNWKNNNLILDYNVSAKRLGKFHYRVFVDLDLTPKQADRMLKEKLFPIFRRR